MPGSNVGVAATISDSELLTTIAFASPIVTTGAGPKFLPTIVNSVPMIAVCLILSAVSDSADGAALIAKATTAAAHKQYRERASRIRMTFIQVLRGWGLMCWKLC